MSSSETATKILVIDDSRASLLGIKLVLEPLGHEVLLADYTEDALMRALTQEIAVVIADVRKPRLDGVRTLARLCNRAGASGTPILCVGGFRHEAAEVYRASELNATDYILRPIEPGILQAKVRLCVAFVAQNRELARANELAGARDRCIATIGHDLRNPLAAAELGLELLVQLGTLTETDRRSASRILESVGRARTLLGSLVDYARESLEHLPLRPASVDIRHISELVVDEIRSIYPDRTIVAEFQGDLVGKWDVDRLGQVLSNLVGNAVEHGAGEVTVHVEGSEDHVTLTVHNWGSPISSEVLPDLYKPFHRGERSARGLGLGLYIVHESLRAHGGTIAARSSATEGTTFIARWPRVIDPPEVARVLPSASHQHDVDVPGVGPQGPVDAPDFRP